MLILVGVSINAIIGEDGLLTKSQYATFLSEMAAVEEAVNIWKAGEAIEAGRQTTAIPTNGMCKSTDLTSTERLTGEVGYYRIWSMLDTQPTANILSSSSEFNNAFESELVFYPAGVQDLYYLNNEACGIDSKKTYLIDAATGMVYSMSGVTLKGVSCYSSNMAKAVMNGDTTAPNFAAAEVSGSGSGEKLAGNVQEEFFSDGSKNPNYNPYGFKIITNQQSNNIYKLYNNGDLYGKGIKGPQLSTSIEDMNKIDDKKWSVLEIPKEIGEYKKVISGFNNIFVIDSDDNLWAWGSNSNNKLGLSQEGQVEYTGRLPIKLNVNGKKVKKVWDLDQNLFVLTLDNELYGMGNNLRYQLGLGHKNSVTKFQKINVPNPENIKYISSANENNWWILIAYNNNEFYASGSGATRCAVANKQSEYRNFLPVFNGYEYSPDSTIENLQVVSTDINYDIDQSILYIIPVDAQGIMILKDDYTIWHCGQTYYNTSDGVSRNKMEQYPTSFSTDVKSIYSVGYGYIVLRNNGEVWGCDGTRNSIGTDEIYKKAVKLTLPTDLKNSGIKEIYTIDSTVYYLSNDNFLYGSSDKGIYLGKEGKPNGIIKLTDTPIFNSLYPQQGDKLQIIEPWMTYWTSNSICIKDIEGNLWTIGNSVISYRDNILEKSWKLIARNVKDIALGNNNSLAVVDKNNCMFVSGNDSRILAQNTPEQITIPILIKLDNPLINDKVKLVHISENVMMILTTDKHLYATGLTIKAGDMEVTGGNPGWNDLNDRYTLVELLDNCTDFDFGYQEKLAINNGELYYWGHNYMKVLPQSSAIPQKWDITQSIGNVSNIAKIKTSMELTSIITKDGKLYTCGGVNWASDRIAFDHKELTDDTGLFNNEKIKDIVNYSNNACIVLTESGNLYGWGDKRYLGVNQSYFEYIRTPIKLNIENIDKISVGNGFFIAIKKDGTVWGTGNNQYGILGRWVGIDRNSPNSRYKTAFEWVECPELEI